MEPSLELSSQATYAGGPVRQPYAYLVPSPRNGTKVTDTDFRTRRSNDDYLIVVFALNFEFWEYGRM